MRADNGQTDAQSKLSGTIPNGQAACAAGGETMTAQRFRFKDRSYSIDAEGINWGVPGKPPREEEVRLCQEWIQTFASSRKTINTKRSSYGLKHVVERWARIYVSNGAFLQAVANLGLEIIPFGGKSPNAAFKLNYPKEPICQRYRQTSGCYEVNHERN